MKIYIDLLFLLNIWIDFFLLLIVKLTLRRITKITNIIVASLLGSLTTFLVFLNISYITLTILKVLLSVLIVIVAFGYKNIFFTLKNTLYLFMTGIILGGIASYLKININNNVGYLILLIVLTPIGLITYKKQNDLIKKQYSLYYQVKIVFSKLSFLLCGFLDSGNNLYDPITKKPVILVSKSKLKGLNKIRSPMYVPIKTINKSSLIKCYKPDKLMINNKEYNNYLVGLIEDKIFIDGIDCLLNNRLMEEL